MPTTPTILDLATGILANAQAINAHIESKGLPQPSFDRDAPLAFPADPEIQGARMALIEAAKTIYDLAVGPVSGLTWSALSHKFETAVLRAVNNYEMAEAVPLKGEASFAAIAAATKLPEDFVTRVIRYAATSRIFKEVRPGYVIHTAASRALLENKLLRGLVTSATDEGFAAVAKMNEAVEKWGHSGEPKQCALNIAYGLENEDMFEWMERPEQKWRKDRFADAMRFRLMSEDGVTAASHAPDPLLDGSFDWEALGNGLVVDMGGGLGHVCTAIARKHKNLRFMVQDLNTVVERGRAAVAEEAPDVAERIQFMEHSFWDPQTIAADVYFMRIVLHDWSDNACVKILRNIIPAMRPKSKILIMDALLPAAGSVPLVVEKLQRTLDLSMMTLLGGKERAQGDWESLFTMTDGRLKIEKISCPFGSQLALIEVSLPREKQKL